MERKISWLSTAESDIDKRGWVMRISVQVDNSLMIMGDFFS